MATGSVNSLQTRGSSRPLLVDLFDFDPSNWQGWESVVELGTGPQVFGITAANQGTATSNTTDATGSFIDYDSTAAIGQRSGWASSNAAVRSQLRPFLQFRIKTGGDLTSQRIFIGASSSITNAGLGDADLPGTTNGASVAVYRYSSVAADANWQAITAQGTTETVTNTGIAVTATTVYRFRIEFVTATIVLFYINDILVARHETNVPAAATDMNLVSYLFNTAAASRRLSMAKMYARHRGT